MRIGIVTMHKVLNFGSVLQAFALQTVLERLGHKPTIINYHYSWNGYSPSSWQYVKDKCRYLAKVIIRRPTVLTRFFLFRHRYLHQTLREYTKRSIQKRPPTGFDVYMTGSDQVWNCKFTNGDDTFLLSFAPADRPKISYASSFASPSVLAEYRDIFRMNLLEYQSILVREKSGVDVVRDLTGRNADVVCDPSLLLKSSEYHHLASRSKIKVNGPYILAYILDYMYNPYPGILDIVRRVKEVLGYKVVYIGTARKDRIGQGDVCLDGIGPLEFLWLVENASFVITTSFHGTAFSSIFHIPLLSVVEDADTEDGRMQTLLTDLKQKASLISCNTLPEKELICSSLIISKEEDIDVVREHSMSLLVKALQQAGN